MYLWLPIAAFVLMVAAGLWWWRKRRLGPSLHAASAEYTAQQAVEDVTLEKADWIGKTGLPEAIEREIPHYLRREFGEFMGDPNSLKASDLIYLGIHRDTEGRAHFWRVPSKNPANPGYAAYAEIDSSGQVMSLGWGERNLPVSPAGSGARL
jgi:hypothetical protein